MFHILQGHVVRTKLLVTLTWIPFLSMCLVLWAWAASAAVALIECSLASLWFVLPRTIATSIARLNCCSMIGYVPPFLLWWDLYSAALDADFRTRCYSCLSYKVLHQTIHYIPHTVITFPFQDQFCVCSNDPTISISPVPSPTVSAANRRSSFLNFRLYDCVICIGFLHYV